MNLTQSKTEFLTEALIEQVNNIWKVNSIESGRNFILYILDYSEGEQEVY